MTDAGPDQGPRRVPPPRRGSGAATQRRDAAGRFVDRWRKPKPLKAKRPAGKRGPSHLWNLRHEQLVERVVALEHKLGRLQAEMDGRLWSDPEISERANMHGLRALEGERVAERVAALKEVLRDLAFARDDEGARDTRKLAELVNEKLVVCWERMRKADGWEGNAEQLKRRGAIEKPIKRRTLYSEPYRGMWDERSPHFKSSAGAAAGASRWRRHSKRLLIHHIQRHQIRCAELEADLRPRLLEASDEQPELWKPLAKPKPRGAHLVPTIEEALALWAERSGRADPAHRDVGETERRKGRRKGRAQS